MNEAEVIASGVGLNPVDVFEVAGIFEKIKPYLSDVAIKFIESTPTTLSSEKTTYFGKTFNSQDHESNYKVFGELVNKLFDELTPTAQISTIIKIDLHKPIGGLERYMLLWYAEFAEFKNGEEAMAWSANKKLKTIS